MITICVIIYAIASLCICHYKYWDIQFSFDPTVHGNVNKCYMNGKRSLIYGFLFIPTAFVIIVCVMFTAYYLAHALFWVIAWIYNNLP